MAESSTETSGWAGLWLPGTRRAVTMITAGIALHAFNELSVAASLPAAFLELDRIRLLPLGYALYFVSVIAGGMLAASARRRFGARDTAAAAGLVFLIGAGTCALAPSAPVFVLGRALQGFADGTVMAICYGLIPELFAAALVPRVFALEALVWAVASVAGPLTGGAVAEHWGWRAAMLVGVPLALAFLASVRGGSGERAAVQPVPWAPVAIALSGAALFSTPTILPDAPWAALGLPAGALACGLALWIDRRQGGRLFPAGAFDLSPLGAGLWVVLLLPLAGAMSTVWLALALRSVWGLSATVTGVVIVILALTWSVVAIPVGGVQAPDGRRRLLRFGPLAHVAGLTCVGLGIWSGTLAGVIVGQALNGAAFGMIWANANQAIVAAAAPADRSRVSSLVPTVQMIGFAIGAGVGGWLGLVLGLGRSLAAGDGGPALGYWLAAAAISALGTLAAQRMRVSAAP